MKIKIGYWIYLIISFALLSLSGCKEEYKTTTKINADGSCERIIIAKVDSSRLLKGRFLVPHDKSWDLQYKAIGKDTQKVFIVHKNFDDVNKINDEYKDKNNVGIEIQFEKKFRWFFSYLTYREIYKSYNRLNRIPVKSYFTKEEYTQIEAGDTSKALKKKTDLYMQESMYEEFYQQFIAGIQKENISNISLDLWTSKKEELKDSLLAGGGETKSVLRSIKNVFRVQQVENYEPLVDGILKDINSKVESMSGIEGEYTNEVIMPGIILNTNAKTLEGNKASWKFNSDKFCLLDNVMVVESRISNVWTIYVTGIVVMLIIILLLIPKFRKTKGKN